MENLKDILLDWRVIILIVLLIVSFLAIQPNIFNQRGAQVVYLSPQGVVGNYSSRGLTTLTTGSIITGLNGVTISSPQQFYAQAAALKPNSYATISYKNEVFPYVYTSSKLSLFLTNASQLNSTYIQLDQVGSSALQYGLDLIGGTEMYIQPNSTIITNSTYSTVENVLKTRLDVYGISGVSITQIQTLSGAKFIVVNMPNIGEAQALSLINNQGQFYAKIGNTTIFNSSNPAEVIQQVCLTSSCPYGGLQPPTLSNGLYNFNFGMALSKQSADEFKLATENLSVIPSTNSLSKPIVLYLNGKVVENLSIESTLKGVAAQTVLITGSGSTYQQAYTNMKTLQAIFQSGSLPVPIKIASINSVSPIVGGQFISQIYILLIVAFIGIAIVVFLRYKNYKISLLILMTSAAEIFIVIGIAALIKWTLDVPSIAGIIASIGVSVDDQIIITDEILRGSSTVEFTNIKKRIKRAFFIIYVSFFSFAAIMFPLFFSTSTLFTGFALTTILATLVGLLVTRPAYGQIITKIKDFR
ncbi:MAG: hypothetical protein OH316_01390 [Candidatus Parvarchaeota archaeon]|nr:hypothetical protein [Candidatus Parvarchaeota archaeon]